MQRICVLVPSRLKKRQGTGKEYQLFIQSAIASIRAQEIPWQFEISIHIGLDSDTEIPDTIAREPSVSIFRSVGKSQALALNVAANAVDTDFIAILEDDDEWSPSFLDVSLQAIQQADFVSSTQLEYESEKGVRRIFDFPTPSGWFMRREVFDKVGLFNPEYRWHLDNEWLGRLVDQGIKRVHLVEATAPIDIRLVRECRPMLAKCLRNGGPLIRLARHGHLRSLVNRLVHTKSGTGQIATDPVISSESKAEYHKLLKRFGRIPW